MRVLIIFIHQAAALDITSRRLPKYLQQPLTNQIQVIYWLHVSYSHANLMREMFCTKLTSVSLTGYLLCTNLT